MAPVSAGAEVESGQISAEQPMAAGGADASSKPLKTPRDLLQHTLIHLEYEAQGAVWPNWRMWMLAAGIRDFNDSRGLHFSQTSLAIQAAIDGHGVALGDSSLVSDPYGRRRKVMPRIFLLARHAPGRWADANSTQTYTVA